IVLLADALRRAAAARVRLLRGVLVAGAAGVATHRPRRTAAGRCVPLARAGTLRLTRRRIRTGTEPLLARRFGRDARPNGVARLRTVVGRRARLRERHRDGVLVDALHVVRAYRPGLVRLRLGDPAPRDRLPRHLPVPVARRAALSAPAAA